MEFALGAFDAKWREVERKQGRIRRQPFLNSATPSHTQIGIKDIARKYAPIDITSTAIHHSLRSDQYE